MAAGCGFAQRAVCPSLRTPQLPCCLVATRYRFSFRAKGQLGERDLRLIAATLHSAIQTSRKAPTDVSGGVCVCGSG